jgi:hypothetical protein
MISELLNCLFEVPCGNQCTSILTSYQPSKKSTKARPFDVTGGILTFRGDGKKTRLCTPWESGSKPEQLAAIVS